MKKSLYTALYLFALTSAGLSFHQAFAGREPSVEPLMEIDIEQNAPKNIHQPGYDFNTESPRKYVKARVPANITSKNNNHTNPTSYLGPFIFLCALPIALWIVISRKFKDNNTQSEVEYYPKTYQLNPKKTLTQKSVDDDDIDFPKAS